MVSYPAQPAPLTPYNASTTWPGGIDPTVSVYRLPATTGGRRKATRKGRKGTRKTRKGRKGNRKAARRH